MNSYGSTNRKCYHWEGIGKVGPGDCQHPATQVHRHTALVCHLHELIASYANVSYVDIESPIGLEYRRDISELCYIGGGSIRQDLLSTCRPREFTRCHQHTPLDLAHRLNLCAW